MANDHPILDMTMAQVLRVATALEAKARTWTVPTRMPTGTLDDVAQIRASLQRSIAALETVLVEWDQRHGRY